MKDWQDEIFSTWETTVKEFENFSQNFSELVENIGEEFVQTVDLIAEKIDSYIPIEIEQFLNELFQPLMDIDEAWRWQNWENSEEEYFTDFTDLYLNPKIEPNAQFHPACRGCHHYHGRVYNQNLLVCGMHPYGWEDENCPDYE